MSHVDVLFEPWSLGDAVVAAATAREDPKRFVLVCDQRWVELLRAAQPQDSSLLILGLHLPYTMRQARTKFAMPDRVRESSLDVRTVYNIRGDLRDFRAARKLFPKAKIRQSGLYTFLARRCGPVDLPARLGLVPIRNRYKAWTDLTSTSFEQVKERYSRKLEETPRTAVIHIGAQWRSKQYPNVLKVLKKLDRLGIETIVVGGPGDMAMTGVHIDLPDLAGTELLRCFRSAGVVIANDSGPMHVAAYLGCKTVCVAGTANLKEWLPPSVHPVVSDTMPTGYRPMPNYMSDQVHSEWPDPELLVEHAVAILDQGRESVPAAVALQGRAS
jgi:Glycosyltransferase family 9 (heptosyltransferase)